MLRATVEAQVDWALSKGVDFAGVLQRVGLVHCFCPQIDLGTSVVALPSKEREVCRASYGRKRLQGRRSPSTLCWSEFAEDGIEMPKQTKPSRPVFARTTRV